MKNKRVLLNIGVFIVVFFVMIGWAVHSIVSVDQLEKPYDLSADFANAFGVGKNAEVTYRGVPYGAVTSVKHRVGGVRLRMKVKRTLQVPADSTATVLRKSVVGEPYVDFEPPEGYTGGGPYLPKNALIPETRTRVPLEFSELLRSASNLISSIPPEDVQTLVHEAAIGLTGRGESLRALTEAGDKLSGTLSAKSDVLDRLLTNQTRLTHVVTEHRASLGRSLTDLEQVSATLRQASANTQVVLDKAAPLVTQAADLVAAQKQNLDCDLKILEIIVDETSQPRRLAELRVLLDMGPKAYSQLLDATDVEPDGRWIRVGLIANPDNPPKQYDPPKPLPPIPNVPGCNSPLRPAASTGTRSIDLRPASQTLPFTGGSMAILFGTIFVLGLAITRSVRPGDHTR
jgi:phospholipid/cholesterol/gamma-HCH transport system substrate-binding protein